MLEFLSGEAHFCGGVLLKRFLELIHIWPKLVLKELRQEKEG